jgi:hypothetical protein
MKIGRGPFELEAGRDANWLGLGERGNITLTNNARNFDLVKLSSPEPISSRFLWDLKYSVILSRLDESVTIVRDPVTGTDTAFKRRPFFLAAKLSFKPDPNVELGINYGKEFGGPGVKYRTLRGVLRGGFRQILAHCGELYGRRIHPPLEQQWEKRSPLRILPGEQDPLHQRHLSRGIHLRWNAHRPLPGWRRAGLLFPLPPLV